MADYMFQMDKNIANTKYDSNFYNAVFVVYFLSFYFLHNLPFAVSVGGMLSQFEGSIGKKIATFMLGGLSSWWFHYMAHKSRIFNMFSGHRHHHQEKTTLLEDAHEFGSNIIAAGGALMGINFVIRCMTKVSLLNDYVLLLFMFGFPLVHLLVYHRILKESYHEEHHRSTSKNFSPDLYDHLFGTNLDNRIENLDHMIPVFLGVGGVLLVAQKYNIFSNFLVSI
jgi:hypothetical protein